DTRWVLARPGESYIAYSYESAGTLGLKSMAAGRYDVSWLDTESGQIAERSAVQVDGGDTAFAVPEGMGREVVVYVRRRP
ncbi:MAG: hypothetical protein AAGJ97_13740, partial [Planctomycetota bacterium]